MRDNEKSALLALLSDKSDTDSKSDLLKSALANAIIDRKKPATAKELTEAYELYTTNYQFQPGDLVQWKETLKDRKMPLEGEPAVVVNVLDEPVFDERSDSGSTYFKIPYDLVLGVLDTDGDFTTYYYNSKRFEPYTNH